MTARRIALAYLMCVGFVVLGIGIDEHSCAVSFGGGAFALVHLAFLIGGLELA